VTGLRLFESGTQTRGITLLLGIAFLLWLPAVAKTQEFEAVVGPDQAAIQSVIESQLAAFQRDDGSVAFSYASPGIRGRFGSAENFMAMVQQGYSAVYRPTEVDFLEARSYSGSIAQAVRFVGPDGRAVIAIYMMERQADGQWLIDGVQIIPIAETTS